MEHWLLATTTQQLNLVTTVPPDDDIQFQFVITNNKQRDERCQQCLTWWRDQSEERRAICRSIAIGHLSGRIGANVLAQLFNRSPDDLYTSWHSICRFPQVNKQTNPWNVNIKIITDFMLVIQTAFVSLDAQIGKPLR